MAALPAAPRVALATLLARSSSPTRPSARVARKPSPLPAPRPLSALERASSIAIDDSPLPSHHYTRPPTAPSALVLWITVARCATCGTVTRIPAPSVLVKYAENEHTVHYRHDDAALHTLPATLPREIRTRDQSIPFCEACFV